MLGKQTSEIQQLELSVDGSRIPFTKAGAGGPPVILLHGGAGDRHDWSKNITRLAESYTVYAPDLIGFGESPRRNAAYTIQDFAEFVGSFIDEIGVSSVHLIGHSLGGRVCLEVALQEPDLVEKLILVAPMGFGRLSVAGYVIGTSAWALFKLIRKPLPYPSLDIELEDRRIDRFRALRAPTLIAWGKRDLFFSPRWGQRAEEIIPNSQLRMFDRSGHSPHKSEADAFNRIALNFLAFGQRS